MKFTIQDFRKRFPNDDACLAELMSLRFGGLNECPECHKPAKFHRVRGRRCYECQWCGYQVYPTQATPFEKTTTPLSSWFYVIYLMTATRSGVSAKEVERQLGVTYKTAWRMCHQIRLLMGMKGGRKLFGHIEADETYVGGKAKGKRGRGAGKKAVVFGTLERGGDVRGTVVKNASRKVLEHQIVQNVELNSTISTDEWGSYRHLNRLGYTHATVSHGAKQWVRGDHHTNGIEGFWSRLKLSIKGTNIHVSKKHLQKYVDEFAFRYNNRAEPTLMFDAALSGVKKQIS